MDPLKIACWWGPGGVREREREVIYENKSKTTLVRFGQNIYKINMSFVICHVYFGNFASRKRGSLSMVDYTHVNVYFFPQYTKRKTKNNEDCIRLII